MAKAKGEIEISYNDVPIRRLRRIEGQVRGIQKMITENHDCVSVVIQLGAVRSAIESLGAIVLKNCRRVSPRNASMSQLTLIPWQER